MELRTATSADAAEIRSVARRSYEEDGTDDSHLTGQLFNRRYAPGWLDERLERADTICVLAERDDEIVGFAEGTTDEDAGRVERLHVAPGHRAEGIGIALYERIGEEL